MTEVLLRKAGESLPIRALLCLGGCAGIAILGSLARGPISGMPFVPGWLKHVLFYLWLGVLCALGAGFLWFLVLELWRQKQDRRAAKKRSRVSAHLHLALQMASELAVSAQGPGFLAGVARYYQFLFYCIPQLLTPASEIRRLAFFVPDAESGDPPALLRVEQACDAFPPEYAATLRLQVTGSVAGKVYRTRKSYRGGPDDPDWQQVPEDPMQNYQTVMCAPVVLNEQVVGVLSIDHSDAGAFSDEDQDHFELFARLFALVCALTHAAQQDGSGDVE